MLRTMTVTKAKLAKQNGRKEERKNERKNDFPSSSSSGSSIINSKMI